jgi:hypothetical protein
MAKRDNVYMRKNIHAFSICLLGLGTLCASMAFAVPAYSEVPFNNFTLADNAASTIGDVLNPFETKDHLYQNILDEMNLEYESIGKREAERVLQNHNTSVTGGLNSIGFTYRRPFVDFSISVDRNLSPAIDDAKTWIVRDTFSIYIDASRVLSNLKDKKVIDITQKNLAAFAGIVFKRTFTWVHFANSYEEGLTTHFEKLFLPFTALEFNHISQMQNNERVLKEDSLSVKAGGIVSAPLYTGITAMAGVLAKFEKLTRVEVVANPSTTHPGNDLVISYEKSKIATAGVSMAIQADFLKILKMTLLSYDLSYELDSSYKINLSINQGDVSEWIPNAPVAIEVNQILKNKEGDLTILAPYVISEEKRISQLINQKYNFLLLGGEKSAKTQQIEVTSAGRVKNFFKHFYEKVKFTEDPISRLFSSVIFAITNTDASAAKLASETKRVEIEYDSERNLLENHEDLNILPNEQKLSLTFSADFSTNKTNGLGGKQYLDRAIFMLERYSGVDPLALTMIRDGHLVAPILIKGIYQVNTEGIRYLNSLSINQVFDDMDGLCNEYPRNKFFNFRNLFDNCRRSLQNDYINYYKDLSHTKITADVLDACEKTAESYFYSPAKMRAYLKDCLSKVTYKDRADWVEIPLWSLKTLTTNIVNNSYSKVHYYNLFGVSNVFFYGNFSAVTEDGRDFTTNFHEGDFKGLGVVDHYMRLENLRAPSSIVVDQ